MTGQTNPAMMLVSFCAGLLVALFASGCGDESPRGPAPSGPPPPTGSQLTLHAEVTDVSGDSRSLQSNPPDLVAATVDVASSNIKFRIRLAPGTFAADATRLYIAFDTDQNAGTGVVTWGVGMDFDAWLYAIDRFAEVRRRTPTGLANLGTVPAGLAADGMDVTIPLSMLGNDDGALDFQIHSSGDPRVPGQSAAILDFMPDEGRAGRIQPTHSYLSSLVSGLDALSARDQSRLQPLAGPSRRRPAASTILGSGQRR